MKERKKIRLNTWYWGAWIYEGTVMDGSRITLKDENFEEYNEEEHGWHHSEEYANGREKPYESR